MSSMFQTAFEIIDEDGRAGLPQAMEDALGEWLANQYVGERIPAAGKEKDKDIYTNVVYFY